MIYNCINCYYESNLKSNFDKHLNSKKHLKVMNIKQEVIIETSTGSLSKTDVDKSNNKSNRTEQPLRFQYLYSYTKTKLLRKKIRLNFVKSLPYGLN